jgi:hypothetical protein
VFADARRFVASQACYPLRMRAVVLTCLLSLAPLAWAQVCVEELRRALPAGDATPGQIAASLLARAVQLVEPALPSLRDGSGPVDGAGGAAEAVTYLHQRRLLPSGWTPEAHSPEGWSAMLAGFAGGYRVDAPAVTGADRETMLDEVARTLEAVADAVRPLPVFAVDAQRRVTFFAVIWNWTPFPRLLLFRPPADLTLAGDGRTPSEEAAAPVLEALSGCALSFDRFVYADEAAALRLFVAQGASTLRVLGTEPDGGGAPEAFGPDDVVAALTFRAPELGGVRVLSASIEGPSPGFGAVLGVLLQVRTNVGLEGALRSLALP